MNPTAAAQLGIKPFEAADYLQSDEDCAQYLQACMDEAPDDAALFTKAVDSPGGGCGYCQWLQGGQDQRVVCSIRSSCWPER